MDLSVSLTDFWVSASLIDTELLVTGVITNIEVRNNNNSTSCFHVGFGSPHRSVGIRWGPEGRREYDGFPLSDGKGRSVGHPALRGRSFWVNVVTMITPTHD